MEDVVDELPLHGMLPVCRFVVRPGPCKFAVRPRLNRHAPVAGLRPHRLPEVCPPDLAPLNYHCERFKVRFAARCTAASGLRSAL